MGTNGDIFFYFSLTWACKWEDEVKKFLSKILRKQNVRSD